MWGNLFSRNRYITSHLVSGFNTSGRGSLGNNVDVVKPFVSWGICSGAKLAFIVVSVVSVVLVTAFSKALGLGMFGIAAIVVWIRAVRRDVSRWQSFDRDFPTLLTSVASSVRAGMDPLVALAAAQSYFPAHSAISQELARFSRELAAGREEVEVISGFMKDAPSGDLDLFKRCLRLSRKHGTSLAEPLHRITRVVRQRHSFRRKTRAALAMHRMSAFGIAICFCLMALLQILTNFKGVLNALYHPIGGKVLFLGGSLVIVGVCWMTRLGREERL